MFLNTVLQQHRRKRKRKNYPIILQESFYNNIEENDINVMRAVSHAKLKGASNWLSTMPLDL